ncbi:MAG: URC4/urg3 family protein [Gammaproteobacteria bacterium]|nr:URC4/urg3 family protein [Gammaproteobacteria bacterium]
MPSGADGMAADGRSDRDTLQTPAGAAAWLRSAAAVRARANAMLALAERDALEHFRLHSERLDAAADHVIETIRQRYPSLEIPFHSRWRHFDTGGIDRWGDLAGTLDPECQAAERARVRFDLAVTSVLLDAGAGDRWHYREPGSGVLFTRSEGLAVASFHAFRKGLFSASAEDPLRTDAAALATVTGESLGRAFQVDPDNPLVGLEERAALMCRLATALQSRPGMFGAENPRVGHLFDYLATNARSGRIPAPAILDALLAGLDGIWPGRPALGGIELGDVWRHPAIEAPDATDGWVPFHKLSQWLAYSLVEPLEEAGIRVTDLDALTGLPEYRNGGLLIDLGVLAVRDRDALTAAHAVDSVLVVEWRALTVALLDRLADRIRTRLGMTREQIPLMSILEGGTWQAGRRIARERRGEAAPPPLRVISDGTVF